MNSARLNNSDTDRGEGHASGFPLHVGDIFDGVGSWEMDLDGSEKFPEECDGIHQQTGFTEGPSSLE